MTPPPIAKTNYQFSCRWGRVGMTTEEKYNMFWNRKKRKQEKERKAMEEVMAGDKPAPEPDISEPIKSFLAVSEEWEIYNWIDDNDRYGHVATDTKTGLSLELVVEIGILGYSYAICLNHEWLTEDEATAVFREIHRIKEERRAIRLHEERQKWTEAYRNRGEVV